MALIDRIKTPPEWTPDVLVWKWPSDQLTLGAQLIVNESQEAIFFKGGKALDLFGPGTHTLSSGNIPLLQKLINLPFGGQTPFSAEVYFVNKCIFFSGLGHEDADHASRPSLSSHNSVAWVWTVRNSYRELSRVRRPGCGRISGCNCEHNSQQHAGITHRNLHSAGIR